MKTHEDYLMLKWGSIKGWDLKSQPALDAMQKWADIDGISLSAMQQGRTAEHTDALCELIDAINGEIWNDWDGVEMTKEEAKAYVRNYRK